MTTTDRPDDRADDNPPPVHRYTLTLTIYGDTFDQIEEELLSQTRGGFLLDSDYHKRDEWTVYGARTIRCMEHINPDMTSERYRAELDAWWQKRKANR